jgi:serine phosphatase RsbU (regulator of sigma subunit)/PAS domain-containing protein
MTDTSAPARHAGEVDWTTAVQEMLDGIPGNHVLMLPVLDPSGEVRDYWIAAASAAAVDAFGRTGPEMIGARLREEYGEVIHGEIWEAFRDAHMDDAPRTVGPFPFPRRAADLPPAQFTVHLRRVGAGVLQSWTRGDDLGRPEERIALTERLANLGWGEWDRRTKATTWSDQLYQIFERDPAAGPLTVEEMGTVVVPADRALYYRALERVNQGRPVDVTFRIHVRSGVKHVRAVTEPVSDVKGRLLRVVGIVQDVTARVTSGTRLASVERQLSEHQASLAAENLLVAQLQQIILPIPVVPIDLRGLRVAVRYLPAEEANRIGGDWYHAGAALDGSVVIAVGDVAGHGIRSAATMAQMRSALTTLIATATAEPADLLRYLNRLLHANGEATDLASVVVARYDPSTGEMRWAQAGHPAPLRTRAGNTTELPRPAGMMLGVLPDPVFETTTITIRPGDLLLFYTDGLVERRDRGIDEGLQAVISILNRLSAEHHRAPLADLLAQLDRANPNDDTCIVALRPLPGGEQPPAGLTAVAPEPVAAPQPVGNDR